MTRFRFVLPLALVVAIDFIAIFVNAWLAVGLAVAAVVIAIANLVYLMNLYDFPWPWRSR